MAEVKPEIKVDAADVKLGDIDQFEEDTDLQIPPREVQESGAWLVKVSEDMWKAWNDIYSNTPVGTGELEVGKLRVYHQKGNEPQRIQIRLEPKYNQHKLLPRAYDLEMKANGYNNTVVFSEKDLPGHTTQKYGGRNQGGSRPTGIQNKNDRYGNRKPGTYRSAIPKQTALAPKILNEAVAKPVEDETALDFFKMQYDVALNAGKKTTFNNNIYKGFGRTGNQNFGFSVGTMTSKPGKGKKKQPKEKAVRISKEELLDKLQACFQEYVLHRTTRLKAHQFSLTIFQIPVLAPQGIA